MRYLIKFLKPLILLFFLVALLISCGNETGTSDSGGHSGNGITVLRIGTFSGINSYSATGQLKILRNDTSLAEVIELLPDFQINNVNGTIELWLTDDNGVSNLSSSTQKALISSLGSGYSGARSFAVPEDIQSTLYKFVVIYKPSSGTNIAKAQLVMPLPPDYSKTLIR